INTLEVEIEELKSQLHDCQYPTEPPRTASLLELTGSATMTDVAANGAESFSFTLNLKNLTSSPVMIQRAEVLLADAGGWAYSGGNPFDPHGIFWQWGVPPALPGNANYPNLKAIASYSFPAEYLIFMIVATNGAETQQLLTQIPINRYGYANVTPL